MSGQDADAQSAQETQPLLAASQPAEVQKTPQELRREQALTDFKRRLIEHREWDAKLKDLRLGIRDLEKAYEKTEEDMPKGKVDTATVVLAQVAGTLSKDFYLLERII